jgi:hypothetical protein
MDGGRALEFEGRNMDIENANPAIADREAGHDEESSCQHNAMNHGSGARPERIERGEAGDAIERNLLPGRGWHFIAEFPTRCPLASQRKNTVHQEEESRQSSHGRVEDREHLFAESHAE